MGNGLPACGCNDRCCNDEVSGKAPADLPGLPPSSSGGPDLMSAPAGARATEPKAGAGAVGEAGCKASMPVVVERRWGRPAKLEALEIGFILPDGSRKTVAFGSVPGWPGTKLGLEFFPQKPCKIKKVHPGLYGEKLGVQADWIVQFVNGDNVMGEEVDYVFELMTRALAQAAEAHAEIADP
mmetsp:Transcript_67030/g.187420  ORF Transcript_67030/g.187420 Transcript_67030/m.187420 type:complete len:182 (+) Transcript_67030:117-662(+)